MKKIDIFDINSYDFNIPQMVAGNRPGDGGNLILSEEEKNILIKNYPQAENFIKVLLGGKEFLHNEKRFCLWLVELHSD